MERTLRRPTIGDRVIDQNTVEVTHTRIVTRR